MRDSATAAKTIYIDLIRHGEPEGGVKFRGSLDDPLSNLGWSQMESAITSTDQWDVVVASPLKRCRAFAEHVASTNNLPCHIEPELREISFGEWEGKTADVIEKESGDLIRQFWADPLNNTPPGAEPLTRFQTRVISGWNRWLDNLEGKRVLMVCHGGTIRMILAEVLGIPLEKSFAGVAIPFACRSRIRIDQTEYGRFSAMVSHSPLINTPNPSMS